jgi:alkylated DNA repair dioxygenase AlkB
MFNKQPNMNQSCNYSDSPLHKLHGLYMFENVINSKVEKELDAYINDSLFENQDEAIIKARQVLHFGYTFDYTTLKPSKSTNDIPTKIKNIIDNLFEKTHISNWSYDQITINKYSSHKGGIGSHVDTHSVFADKIVVISLNAPVIMVFELPSNYDNNKTNYPERVDLWIPSRSLMIMSGISRYLYKHRIVSRMTDLDPNGQVIKRKSRTSITIRKINKDSICKCNYSIVCDYHTPNSLVLPTRLNK